MWHRILRQKIALVLIEALLICWCVTAVGEAAARQPIPLPVEVALKMKYFSVYAPASFSANGKWLAYAARENSRNVDVPLETYETTGVPFYASAADIYLLNLEDGEVRNLTEKGDNWLPTWSPDGRLLAFLSDRDGSGQAKLWVWDSQLNQLRMALQKNVRGTEIEWLPDSSGIVAAVAPEALDVKANEKRKVAAGASKEQSDQQGVTDSTVRLYRAGSNTSGNSAAESAGPWDLDRYVANLALVDLHSGGDPKVIATGGRISTFFLSPDGTQVAYTRPKGFERPGSQQILFDMEMVNLQTKQEKTLASNIRLNISGADFDWSPDGLWIGFVASGMEETRSDCYAINIGSGELYNLTAFSAAKSPIWGSSPLWDNGGHLFLLRAGELWRATIGQSRAVLVSANEVVRIKQLITQKRNALWSPDGDKSTIVLAHDSVTGHDGFYRIDLGTGSARALAENGHCYTCVVKQSSVWVSANGRALAFIREDAGTAADMWQTDSGMQNPVRLTRLNPRLEDYEMGKARLVRWLGDDGQKLTGTLLLPGQYKEGMRYPLIVWVYGGDSGANHLDTFGLEAPGPLNMQLLATRGYAVLMPDAPLNLGSPMFDLAKTVLPGISKIIEMGLADPDRVGVMGHSYGGYSALSLIVQSKRFAAAIEIDGMGDLIGSYGGMDAAGSAYGTATAEHGGQLMGGTPWEFRNRYIENSPLFFLDRVSTPLLIVHGAADTFVPPFLADELFVGLRRLGGEVVYAKYNAEGHDPSLWSYPNQVDLSYRIIEWFDKYLKSASSPSPENPQ
jgi:dipeptidyl aminopeptidase/acylaminoacyl peptidase